MLSGSSGHPHPIPSDTNAAGPAPETVELDECGAIINGLVNLTHHRSGPMERFPDHQVQVGGFVLSPTGRLVYLRWVPGKRYANAWDAVTETLHFQVPDRSQHFLHGAIDTAIRERSPVNVMLLIGNTRYDVGTFEIRTYQHPALTLQRVSPAAAVAATFLLPTATPPGPAVAEPPVDSQLESQYRRLLAAWGVTADYHRIMYHLQPEEGAGLTTIWSRLGLCT